MFGSRLTTLFTAISTLAVTACGSTPPEENSGGDAYRNEAMAMPLDEWVTGELNLEGGDTTDWKEVVIEEAGKLMVELKAEKASSVLYVGVYDKHGLVLGDGTRKKGVDAKVPVKAKYGGRYFVRIQHRGGAKTAYSVRAVVGESGGDAVPDL